MAMATVTIDRGYFETLLRRADLQQQTDSQSVRAATVQVLKAEHDILVQAFEEYGRLRAALLQGGIPVESIAVLTQPPSTASESASTATGLPSLNGAANTHETTSLNGTASLNGDSHSDYKTLPSAADDGATPRLSSATPYDSCPAGHACCALVRENVGWNHDRAWSCTPETTISNGLPEEYRTMVLKNLPETTDLKDIAGIVRGGLLLEIYQRPHIRAANVTFVSPAAAEDFFARTRRQDIYLGGRRVQVSWSSRMTGLSNLVAHRLAQGATRNLVIEHLQPGIQEYTIRDDLEHIHNLQIVALKIEHGCAFISLNSIWHAISARGCMSSRARYKRPTMIDFAEDECALPFPPYVPAAKYTSNQSKKSKTARHSSNRFAALALDTPKSTSELDDETVDSQSHSGVSLPTD